MNRIVTLLILLLTISALRCQCESHLSKDTQGLNANQEYHIILLGGQSNMVGSGEYGALPDSLRMPPQNVTFIDMKKRSFFSPRERHFGPEIGISHYLGNEYPEMNFALLKYAVHASSLLDWAPDYSTEDAKITGRVELGSLYHKFLEKFKKSTKNKQYSLLALLWMQGERDAHYPVAGKNYENNFRTFADHLRKDLECHELPIILGKINPPANSFPAVEIVRNAQVSLSESVTHVGLVNCDDLSKHADQVHYDTAGQLELGYRFAVALEDFIKK